LGASEILTEYHPRMSYESAPLAAMLKAYEANTGKSPTFVDGNGRTQKTQAFTEWLTSWQTRERPMGCYTSPFEAPSEPVP